MMRTMRMTTKKKMKKRMRGGSERLRRGVRRSMRLSAAAVESML